MIKFLRQLLPIQAASHKPQPRAVAPRFRPRLQSLDDRITPTLGFATQLPFTVGTTPYGVAVGDFNGDGRIDVVTANYNSGNVTVHGVKCLKSKAFFGPEGENGSVLDPFLAFDTRKTLENRHFTP